MLKIDGSHLEGGGQIVRSAVALSAVTGIPVEINRIRAKRKQAGLRFQHCAAVRTVACACDADTEGNEPGSDRLLFFPGTIRRSACVDDVGTAGSIALVLQSWLPVALTKGGILEVTGGTEVPASPTIDYLENVLIPALGVTEGAVSVTVTRRGYYPAGGGLVRVSADSQNPGPISLKKDPSCGIRSCSSGLPVHVAERQAATAQTMLSRALGIEVPVDIQRSEGRSKGSSCTAWYGSKGFSSLGSPGLPAEEVGKTAAAGLISEVNSPGEADPYLSDQLLISLARYGGSFTTSSYTLHARTMCWLLALFGYEIQVREGREVVFSA